MAEIIFLLCVATSALCAFLLLKAYRGTRNRLLFWCGVCFVGLAINNLILFVDYVFITSANYPVARVVPALVGLAVLVNGLIQNTTE